MNHDPLAEQPLPQPKRSRCRTATDKELTATEHIAVETEASMPMDDIVPELALQQTDDAQAITPDHPGWKAIRNTQVLQALGRAAQREESVGQTSL